MSQGAADVAILTVIPAELHAALAAFGIPETSRRKDRSGTVYYYGQVASQLGGRPFSVVVGCIGMAGNPSAAAAAAEFIQIHQPRAFFLLGIAAGIRGKVKIGEVVFSDRIVAYEPAALVREGAQSWAEPRPEMDRLPHAMNQDLMAYRADPARLAERVQRLGLQVPRPPPGQEAEFQRHVAGAAALRIATIASGEKLLRDPAKLHAVRAQLHGKVEAGEMESAGVVAACSRRGIPWLVARGISDFGDQLKSDTFHGYAAGMAAVMLADFIEHGLELGSAEAVGPTHALTVSVTELMWPYVDFSVVNTADHPIQITGSRIRRLVMLPHTHSHDVLKGDLGFRAIRIPLDVDWDSPRDTDRFNVLGSQVLNLGPGEAEAFRLNLATEDFIALVALEIDWLSAKSPRKNVLRCADFLAVHPSWTSSDISKRGEEGAISVVSGREALDCLVDSRPPCLWKGTSFADCEWESLLWRAAGHFSRHDPEGSFARLRQAPGARMHWGSILASFAEVFDPSESRLWAQLEVCLCEPPLKRQHKDSRPAPAARPPLDARGGRWGTRFLEILGIRRSPMVEKVEEVEEELPAVETFVRGAELRAHDARLVIDRILAYRKGSETEWLLGLIDANLEALSGLTPLSSVAFEQLTVLQRGRSLEYLMALAIATGAARYDTPDILEHVMEALGSWPSPPPADLLPRWRETRRSYNRNAEYQLIAWWKQARLQPGPSLLQWRHHSSRLSRFWDLLLSDAEEEALAEVLHTSDPMLRCAVAMRAGLPAFIAVTLARDASPAVQRALVRNPVTSRVTLRLLAHYGDSEVREEAKYRLFSGRRETALAPDITSRELEDGVGYIHVPHFEDNCIVEEFEQALAQFQTARGLILDVRDNPGGDSVLVGQLLERLSQNGRPGTYKGPVVVLLNDWSAQVAEAFARALEIQGRAKVMGALLRRDSVAALDRSGLTNSRAGVPVSSREDPLLVAARRALLPQRRGGAS